MLTELARIGEALSDRVDLAPTHPEVQPLARKQRVLHVMLGEDGRPLEAEAREAGTWWTMRKGNHNSFPFFKWETPLFAPADTAAFERGLEAAREVEADGLWAFLDEELATAKPAEAVDPLTRTYRAAVTDRRRRLDSLDGTDAEVVIATFDRFFTGLDDRPAFFAGLRDVVREAWDLGDLEGFRPEEVLMLLFGGGEKMPLYLDAAGYDRIVPDPRNANAARIALHAATSTATGVCDLTGRVGPLHKGLFPTANAGPFSKTSVLSRNPEADCNLRYGRAGADILTVGHETVQHAAAAFEYLTAKEREGTTWATIRSDSEGPTVLLVHATVEGFDRQEGLAGSMVAGTDPTDETGEARMLAQAAALVDALGGTARQGAVDAVGVMILERPDPATVRMLATREVSAEALSRAAEEWRQAWAAHPPVPLWIAMGKKQPRQMHGRLPAPGPFAVPDMSRLTFPRDGSAPRATPSRLTVRHALALWLDGPGRERTEAARLLLDSVLRNRTRHGIDVAVATTLDQDPSRRDDGRYALETAGLLGLALHTLGDDRRTIMESAGYRLGALLAAADAVHAAYGVLERKENLPRAPIGNAHFSIALRHPTNALARFAQRWDTYAAWAQRTVSHRVPDRLRGDNLSAKDRRKAKLHWIAVRGLRAYREIPELVDGLATELPDRPDDTFRAQLVLGYMGGAAQRRNGHRHTVSADAGTDESTPTE